MKRIKKVQHDMTAYISEQDLAEIRPDYHKWRKNLFFLIRLLVVAVALMEIGVNIILFVDDKLDVSVTRQVVMYLIIPTGLNMLAVLVDLIMLKCFSDKTWLLNYTLVLTIVFMCTVVAATHYVFSITLTIFMMPVMISIIFSNRRLTTVTALCSCVGVVLAVSWRYLEGGQTVKKYIVPETVLALGMIFLALIIARTLLAMMEQQNMKLINAIVKEKLSQEEALAANNAKSTFLANMSHEIRTPLNAVLGMNEMIIREEKVPEIRGYAEKIRTAGNSLLAIVNDVLDISKIESGRLEIVMNEYELSSLVSDCCSIIAVRAQEKGLNLNVCCNGNVPLNLIGDETHIRQVVVNLLTNAVKYTEKGSVTLTVSGDRTGNSCLLRFSVKDTGVGISEEDQKKLFTQFQRFDLLRNRNIEGTGLGLAIVKQLSDLMKGSVKVNSAPGKGSEFIFELPQTIGENSEFGEINVNYSVSDASGYSHTFEAPDAHILVVDDLPVNQLVIVSLLKDTRINTDTAGSGTECLEAAGKRRYDLILMDHMMPEMDGIETHRRLRADKSSPSCDVPVIMLTANALAGMREEYIQEGFADYLSKPVRYDKLEEVIRRNLPKELVLPPSEKAETTPDTRESEFLPLVEALPQLNPVMGMRYCCNSSELYRNVLRDFLENGRYEEMRLAFDERRWEDYRRCVHSLKSTSKTIGLDGLSERARASELALKNGFVDFAVLDHDELMSEYRDVLTEIENFLNK